MAGFSLKRKMMRTKRESLLTVESENRIAIQAIMTHLNNNVGPQMATFQKLILAMKQVLVQRRLMTDLEIQSALSSIEELERMKREGLILGEKKNEQSG